jgi:hypothetical protein
MEAIYVLIQGNKIMSAKLKNILAGCVFFLSCFTGAPAYSQNATTKLDSTSHDHAHEGKSESTLLLDHGKPWATDAALRKGMSQIQAGFLAALPAYKKHKLSQTQANELAKTIEKNTGYMVANCKLKPNADATLHVLLGQLLESAAAIKADPHSAKGMPRIHATLETYPRYFSHPGWMIKTSIHK